MDLPFPLSKKHKSDTKRSWKNCGLLCTEKELEEIYQQYIYSTNCELCGEVYKSRRDRCMEHCHETGKFRNICCQRCNLRKRDVKIRSTNTSGYKNIYKHKTQKCKQGFNWVFAVRIDGKKKTLKTSVDLEKIIQFRDQWLAANPDYYT
jgi:hypothetical protein